MLLDGFINDYGPVRCTSKQYVSLSIIYDSPGVSLIKTITVITAVYRPTLVICVITHKTANIRKKRDTTLQYIA